MRYLVLSALFIFAASFPALAADAELTLKGERIFLAKGGQSTPLDQDMFPAQPIENTDMRFVGLGADSAAEHGVAPGLYLFKGDGPPEAFVPTDEAEFCADVKFSPDMKILAMDAGMSLVRNWLFFSYPDLKPWGQTVYYQTEDNPTIIWLDEGGVLVSTMEQDEHGRACEYDPCGPVSVSYYNLKTRKSAKLLPGTDLCDYTLTGLNEDGTAAALEMCLATPQAWKTFPDSSAAKAVTVKLP
ncbi:MAG: hypothetical protein LBV79_02645 [Candidatus Adiutrix sp.]|jgi:hypothetical protein|nr:hypothetical protein [Candidatus Adiutrix sp.]